MKADAEAVLFSLKCLVAALLAYYVALAIGLNRPFWAVVTSYIIAQPLAGAVLSKAVFRLIGTILGAAASVILVPAFVNEPGVLTAALALWLGFCVYVSLLDRTPRAYMFLLGGYTASIISLPSIGNPGHIFDVAILRVQEIVLGIVAASLAHGLILPRSVTERLLGQADRMLEDAEKWSRDALRGAGETTLDRERRRLALDLADLNQLSVHLPFDTARLAPRTRTLRALQNRMSLLFPLAGTIEDRLAALRACEGGVPAEIATLAADIADWLDGPLACPGGLEMADDLMARAEALEPAIAGPGVRWREMLAINLVVRLRDLVEGHRDLRLLRAQLRSAGARAVAPRVELLLADAGRRALHIDHAQALRSALGTIATIAISCTFWIESAWADGAGAVLIAGTSCALFASLDQPARGIRPFFIGSGIGLIAAIFYAFVIMPRVTDFVTLAATLAPFLLIMGVLMAKPATTAVGIGMVLGFPAVVGLNATYQGNFGAILNSAIAQQVGIGFSIICVGLFQTVGTDTSIGRILRASWRDVALRATGGAPDTQRWLARMMDRIGLLVPRLAALESDPGERLGQSLIDLRIGIVAGDLDRLGRAAPPDEAGSIGAMLGELGRHYRRRRAGPAAPPETLLAAIDRTVDAVADDPVPTRRRDGLVLLTSLRRNLFPAAEPYGVAA